MIKLYECFPILKSLLKVGHMSELSFLVIITDRARSFAAYVWDKPGV